MSIYLKDYLSKKAIIYLKLIVSDKKMKSNKINDNTNDKDNANDKLRHYEIPGISNYDYKAETDNYLGVMNINIENIPVIKNEEKNIKIVRALFAIHINNIFDKNYYNSGYKNYYGLMGPINQRQISPYNSRFDYDSSKENTINILVSPGMNNYKRIDTVPYTFYFSNTSLIKNNDNINQNNKKIYDGNKEIKIYSLDKISDKDNKMIIQINKCSGDYDIKISSKVVDYDDNSNDINYEESSKDYGRKIYLLDKLKTKHIYVSIKSKQNEAECNQGLKKDSNNITCSKELSYLLHYYSATDKQFLSAEPNRKLSFRFGNNENELIIILPKLKEFDYQNNYRDKNNMEYSIFYTYNKTYSKYIESFCYLGHILEKNDESEIKLIKNAKLNDKNEFLVNNIDYGRQIFINVLARNIKTSELILYKPIKGRLVTSTSTKVIALFIALFLVGIIVFISSTYYNEKNLEGYKLAGSSDMRSEDIRYTNINSGP